MTEPIRILQVLPALNFCGGIENYVMNYYRHIDREKIQFDFVTHTNLECSYKQEILEMGGCIFELPEFKLSCLYSVLDDIDKLFKTNENKYAAVHCHMANAACFYFWKARKYGIKNLILHSHNSASSGKLSHTIRNFPLLRLGNFMATERVACTALAGRFLFKSKKFKLINNAIDVDKFLYNSATRNQLRSSLGWKDKIIIGHVGRMSPQKNQSYLLEIFAELKKIFPSYYLVLIGQGEDELDIRKKATLLGIVDDMEIIPPTNNVADYYQAFDAFVFPSLYEGLGIVLIEAQVSGLPTYSSRDNVPTDVNITDVFHFLSLNQNPREWAREINSTISTTRKSKGAEIRLAGYDIQTEAEKLEKMYLEEEKICSLRGGRCT